MSTTPTVPYRLEFAVEVPGTQEQVWQAIATAKGMSAWFLPTTFEERVGSALHFAMGPDMGSDGKITEWEAPRRIAYEEDWASLMGKGPDELSPMTSEFVVEALSGGTCVVRVTTSGFGTGADWEAEWWADMGVSVDAALVEALLKSAPAREPAEELSQSAAPAAPAVIRRGARTVVDWANEARAQAKAATTLDALTQAIPVHRQ